jgi:glycosyltransferase involved in cell wall biosynthesis
MQDRDPYVSVILPTFNRVRTLPKALESVLNQTFEDFELIIVDDGSIDETPAVISSLSDRRLISIRHASNSGVSAARNSGIKASRGRLIAFQDSDDEWERQKLWLQVEKMEMCDPSVGVVYAPFIRHNRTSTRMFPLPGELLEGDIHTYLLFRNLVSTQVAVVKRECFESAGFFDESLPCLVDWELWLRISRTYQFSYVEQPLAQVYFTSNSISSDKNCLAQALENIIQKHRDDFLSQPEAMAAHQYEIGVLQCLSGEYERGRGNLLQVVKANPDKIYYWLAVLVALLGEKTFRNVYELRNFFVPSGLLGYK